MVRFLKLLVLVPLAIVAVAFAIANRHLTSVSFDPFSGGDIDAPQVTAPLFVILLLTLMFGVILGGLATWLTQGRNRRAARQARAEVERLRTQVLAVHASPIDRPALAYRDGRG